MRRILSFAVLALFVCTSTLALARGIIWDGEYQQIENNANMKRAPATIRLVGNPKKPSGYECSFSWDGKDRVVAFTMDQCTRTGSHLVCTSAPKEKKGPFTGDACWGDIYYKKSHPSELSK